MTSCEEVLAIAEKSGVAVSIKDGRLSIRGAPSDVERILSLAKEVRDDLIAKLTLNHIRLTHITTRELIFNDPATGKSQHIPAGTPCRQFADPKSAEREGALSGYEENWGATRNLQSGYALIWVAGKVRGVGRHDFALRTDQ